MKTKLWLVLGVSLMIGASSVRAEEPLPKAEAGSTPAVDPAAPAEKQIVLVPGPGAINADNLNVRGRAGFVGEPITKLNKSDAVTVVEQIVLEKTKPNEPAVWAKILMPAGQHVWVHSAYVTNGTVVPRRLNVRAGAGENYSVVGLVERGDQVKEVSRKGNWVQIEAPEGTFAFVAARYVQQEGVAPAVAPVVAVAPPVKEGTPEVATVNETDPIAPPPTGSETSTTETASLTGDTPEVTGLEETIPPPEEPLPPRIVTHEGVVRPTISIQAPTVYEIWDPVTRMTINYLYTPSTNLDLSLYKGLRILVTGEEGLDERWRNTPVLTIQRIQVLQ